MKKLIMVLFFSALFSFALTINALTGTDGDISYGAPPLRKTLKVKDEQSCKALGGKWGYFGFLYERRDDERYKECNLPTKDAGKPCSDRRDCQSACIAPAGAKKGDRVEGKCYGWTVLLGKCLAAVEEGIAGDVICMD